MVVMMIKKNINQLSKSGPLYSDKSYIRYKIMILGVSILFLMVRFGAVVPELDKLAVKGFRIISLSKAIAFSYLVWIYLYFSFYQKYWDAIEKEIIQSKKDIFKEKIAKLILHDTHERRGDDFQGFDIESLHPIRWFQFFISYAPVTFEEDGQEINHGKRSWMINLTLKHNRKYLLPYLAEVYCRGPIVTSYIIPFSFPVVAWFICMIGDWPGSLTKIILEFLK
jgi:hypothetical protein